MFIYAGCFTSRTTKQMFTLVVHAAEFIKTRPIQDEWNRSVGRPTNYVISSHKTYFTLLLLNSFLLQTPLFVFYKFWIMQVVSLALILYNLEKNPEFPRFPCLCEKEIGGGRDVVDKDNNGKLSYVDIHWFITPQFSRFQ